MTEPHPDDPDGYYIYYEDTDSRVKPCYGTYHVEGHFETELGATKALLTYFEGLQKDAVRCVKDTKTDLERLQQCQT